MQAVTGAEMARIESLAYAEGASEELFMHAAGCEVASAAVELIEKEKLLCEVLLLIGKGNNAGDAYVAGTRLLLHEGCAVYAWELADGTTASPLCQLHRKRFILAGGVMIHSIPEDFSGLIIDGVFGTGYKGAVEGLIKAGIDAANASGQPILAVDIPSALDAETGETQGSAMYAHTTLFLGLPKQGFFLRSGWDHVGRLRRGDFGLKEPYLAQAQGALQVFSSELLGRLLPPLPRIRHKYQAGYVVALAGSSGMPGAAQLSCLAALRTGAGIVRLMHPPGMEAELATSSYEVIRTPCDDIEVYMAEAKRAGSCLIGPGMGRHSKVFKQALAQVQVPLVLDADALNMIAEEGLKVPTGAILTPHHGEMGRLLGENLPAELTLECLDSCQAYAEAHQVTVVLKGAPTFVLHPGVLPHVCAMGDPGMATAGSGDVLAGMIAALLAQGSSAWGSASLGVCLHALAGEIAAGDWGSRGMTATDIVYGLPEAFKSLVS